MKSIFIWLAIIKNRMDCAIRVTMVNDNATLQNLLELGCVHKPQHILNVGNIKSLTDTLNALFVDGSTSKDTWSANCFVKIVKANPVIWTANKDVKIVGCWFGLPAIMKAWLVPRDTKIPTRIM